MRFLHFSLPFLFQLSFCQHIPFNKLGRALIWATESGSFYSPSFSGRQQFLRVRHTSGDKVNVSLKVNGVSVHHQRSPAYWQITLTPNRLPVACPDARCYLSIILEVSMDGRQNVPIEVERGLMLEPNLLWKDSLLESEKKTYAYHMSNNAAPALIRMTPDTQNSNMDLDLFGYRETSSVYFFPNVNEQNHVGGYPESILLSPEKGYYEDGELYFFEVYASPDSSFHENGFSIGVRENYVEEIDWFEYYVFGFIVIVGTAFLFSLVLSLACGYIHAFPRVRSRIFYWLRLRDNPNPNGASKKELRRIEVVNLNELTIDTTEDICSICLDEFTAEGPISRLPCAHVFHKDCSETWLRRNKTCPLCKHDISRPLNEVAVDVDGEGGNPQPTPVQRLLGRMGASRLLRVLRR